MKGTFIFNYRGFASSSQVDCCCHRALHPFLQVLALTCGRWSLAMDVGCRDRKKCTCEGWIDTFRIIHCVVICGLLFVGLLGQLLLFIWCLFLLLFSLLFCFALLSFFSCASCYGTARYGSKEVDERES